MTEKGIHRGTKPKWGSDEIKLVVWTRVGLEGDSRMRMGHLSGSEGTRGQSGCGMIECWYVFCTLVLTSALGDLVAI